MKDTPDQSRSLAQSLAVQTQVHLVGTVGRGRIQVRHNFIAFGYGTKAFNVNPDSHFAAYGVDGQFL